MTQEIARACFHCGPRTYTCILIIDEIYKQNTWNYILFVKLPASVPRMSTVHKIALGGPCSAAEVCIDDNSKCQDGTCRCTAGFSQRGNRCGEWRSRYYDVIDHVTLCHTFHFLLFLSGCSEKVFLVPALDVIALMLKIANFLWIRLRINTGIRPTQRITRLILESSTMLRFCGSSYWETGEGWLMYSPPQRHKFNFSVQWRHIQKTGEGRCWNLSPPRRRGRLRNRFCRRFGVPSDAFLSDISWCVSPA